MKPKPLLERDRIHIHTDGWARVESVIYGLLILALLIASFHTLYYFPVPDSYIWYGDESVFSQGARAQLTTGRMLLPFALGSPLSQSPGFMIGAEWLFALLYGLPQLILPVTISSIDIARTVSFALSITTLCAIFALGRRLRVPPLTMLLAVLLLVATHSFTLSSHSGRYDAIIGLTVLVLLGSAVVLFDRGYQFTRATAFLFGICAVLAGFVVSRHLTVLLPLPLLYASVRLGLWKNGRWPAMVLGGVTALAALVIAFYLATGYFSLFGPSTYGNQYHSVLSTLPIRHPFSLSSQSRIVSAKAYYLWDQAMVFGIVLAIVVVARLAAWRVLGRTSRFATDLLLLYLIASYYLQSTLPYYVAHFLPYLVLNASIVGARVLERRTMRLTMLTVSVAMSAVCFLWLDRASNVSLGIAESNDKAVRAALAAIPIDARVQKPLVLAQFPALHVALTDTTVRVMTESFVIYPGDSLRPSEKLRQLDVRYVLDYGHGMSPQYQSDIDTFGHMIFSREGVFNDRGVDYTNPKSPEYREVLRLRERVP